MTTNAKTVDMGNGETCTIGVVKNADGTWTALTYTRSRTFKREKYARAWYYAAMGFAA